MKEYRESAQLLERAKKVLAGGVSSEFRRYNYPHALFFTHAKGSRIYDVDGNEYLDFTLSQGPMILGHSHPEVLKAVEDYSNKGQLFAGQHIQELELAEKIQELIPSAERIRFSLSGSEAVQTAIRVARAKTKRNKFLRFEGHYHGWLDNVAWGLSVPQNESLGKAEEPNVFPWSKGLPADGCDEFEVLPWNNLQVVKNFLESKHQKIAAIITEPVMCNKGCILPKEGYLEGLRKLCDQYGIALIFDEVITGFRLGLGGAQNYFNVTPDLTIFAKAIASGYPLSVIVGKKDWMEVIENSEVIHAGTLNSCNGPVAAALATIRILERENPYQTMFFLGQKLMDGILRSGKKYDHDIKVMGPGPMFCIAFTTRGEINDFRDTLDFDAEKLKVFIREMQKRGIRVIGRGLFYISAVHTEEDVDHAIEVAEEVFSNM